MFNFFKKESIGWREWVSLPDWGVKKIKAKIDTGAKTSALHAEEIEFFRRGGKNRVRFKIYPRQRSKKRAIVASAEMIDQRQIRSSIGHVTLRPVVKTKVLLGRRTMEIQLTLVNRDLMGYRMLLGRSALAGHYLIDPSRSYLMGKIEKKR